MLKRFPLLGIILLTLPIYPAQWEVMEGQFAIEGDTLHSEGKIPSKIVSSDCPILEAGTFQVSLRVHSRTVAGGGWVWAGVSLYLSPNDYWQFALVEGPNGERYAELAEMLRGVWQAQTLEGSKLEGKTVNPSFSWEYNTTYLLRLSFNSQGIKGEVLNPATGELLWNREFVFSIQNVVKGGRMVLSTNGLDSTFSKARWEGTPWVAKRRGKKIAIFQSEEEGFPKEFALKLFSALKTAGAAEVELLDENAVISPSGIPPDVFLLLLPDSAFFPITAKDKLLSFLQNGGSLFAIGGPLFSHSIQMEEEKWRKLQEDIGKTPMERVLIDFASMDLGKWQRAANDPSSPTTYSVEEGPHGSPVLKFEVSNLTGWDTLLSPPLENPFPQGHNLTCFWARGDENTPSMLVEWREKDGSRWIATVPLSTSWRYYVLIPERFLYWPDNPSKGRGGEGDRFNPSNAQIFSIGVALGHGTSMEKGHHTIWISNVGTAKAEYPSRPDLSLPILETLSPSIKYYEMKDVTGLQKAEPEGEIIAGERSIRLQGPLSLLSPVPRMRGLGFYGDRTGRWIPILEVSDKPEERRIGSALSMFVNFAPPYLGSVFAQMGIKDEDYLLRNFDVLFPLMTKVIDRIEKGIFLTKAGAEYFSYFQGERGKIGAQIVNFSSAPRQVKVRLRILKEGKELWKKEEEKEIKPGGKENLSWDLMAEETGEFLVRTEVWQGKELVDVIEQEVRVLREPRDPKDEFVYVKDGDFYLKGEKWYPHGLNYWPSYIAGQEVREYWLHWLNPAFYDPEIVEKNLWLMKKLGMNMVSIQLGAREQVPQVNDFLERAQKYGLKVNLFIAGAHPLYTDEKLFTDLINKGKFKGNSTIFAYDIAWEPHWGGHGERKRWDREWEKWVIRRYGSIENAEKDWGYPIPRDEKGQVTNPADTQLRQDGPWLKMVCAYCRFLDDFVSKQYGRVIRKIKSLDPNHLVSARSCGQPSWTGWFAYDLIGTAKHFDFLSPEGWGLKPEEAGFTTAYSRFVGEGKPVFWAEFGYNIYPDVTPENMERQAKHYEEFYRMILQSQANGSAGWWFPGGYRVDEKSDFGIINPDNTPRPAGLVLRDYAKRICTPRPINKPNFWLTIDRDRHCTAYEGVYNENKGKYVEAIKQGKLVGVRVEASGTDSLNVPLVAVGNVPYNGSNPPKYLNAEFNWIRVKARDGRWVEIDDDATLEVEKGKPIEIEVSVGNTGIAKWIAPRNAKGKRGGVFLVFEGMDHKVALPKDCPRLEDAIFKDKLPGLRREKEVRVYMEAEGRAKFGEVIILKFVPISSTDGGRNK